MNEELNHRHWPDWGTRHGDLSFLSLQPRFDAIWCCYVQGIPKSMRCQPFELMYQWSGFVSNTVSVVVPTHWKRSCLQCSEGFSGGTVQWCLSSILLGWTPLLHLLSGWIAFPTPLSIFPQDFQNIWSVLVDAIRYAIRAWCRCLSCLFYCLLHLIQLGRADIKPKAYFLHVFVVGWLLNSVCESFWAPALADSRGILLFELS